MSLELPSRPDFINLRDHFAEIMAKHGYWALLRRAVGARRVGPFDEQTHEGIRLSDLQRGKGYKDHWIRIRRMSLFDAPEKSFPVGKEASPLVRFYMQSHVKPDVHDFILEVAQDESSLDIGHKIQPNLPINVVKIWDVNEVTPMREHAGRVEFWQLFAYEAFTGET